MKSSSVGFLIDAISLGNNRHHHVVVPSFIAALTRCPFLRFQNSCTFVLFNSKVFISKVIRNVSILSPLSAPAILDHLQLGMAQ